MLLFLSSFASASNCSTSLFPWGEKVEFIGEALLLKHLAHNPQAAVSPIARLKNGFP